ncbi:MAG: LPS export ABC transporter permease LptG [Candidatus Rokubacteria bacterium]|nr:LPS export ABC transporter permease LptG [Candidatus Rokubacteria bacterium]
MLATLDRYVFKELFAPFVTGVAVFTFFLVIDRIYHLTDLVITKGVPFHLVLSLLVSMLPSFLVLTLPMALLVAALIAGGRLAADLEVTALRACGVSPLRLFRPFLVAALLVTLASASLTLVVNPWSNGAFQRQLFRILQSRATTGIKERTFSASFGQFTIYVQEITPSQRALKGLLVADERNAALSRIIVAREGRILTDEARGRITLRFLDGQISESDVADARRARYTAFALYDMTLPLESPLAAVAQSEKPERDLPLRALLQRAHELERLGQIAAPYFVEFHKRLALPAAALVFVMVGYPLAVRSHRGGRGAALAASLAIVMSYYVVFTSLEGTALRGRLPAWSAVWLPNLLFFLGGASLLRATTLATPAVWMRLLWRLRDLLAPLRRPAPGPGAPRGPAPARKSRGSTFLLDRYLLREYLKFLGIGLAIGAVLFVVVDLLQTLDRFLRVKPPLAYILQHFAFRLPGALYDGLPIVVLMATVFLFLSLTRQRELDALKAAGVSLYRVSLPVLLLTAGVSLGAVTFQETLLPGLNARAEEVDRVKIRGGLPRHLQKRNQIWYRSSDTRFFRMELLDPVEQSAEGLLVLEIDPSFRLTTRLDARKARWRGSAWELSDGVLREITGQNRVESQAFTRTTAQMPETMDDFTSVQKPPDAMSFRELRSYVTKLQESGHHVGKYVVGLYSKLSFPVIHVIMALVAIPFALVAPRSGGRAAGVGVALVISVGYWVVHSMALAFAKADLLPPILAAWTANIVFAGLGAALFLRART